VFGVTVVYLLIRMYIKRFCRKVDIYGQDPSGFARRPDLLFLHCIVNASERTQYLFTLVVVSSFIIWMIVECGWQTAR